MKKLTRRVLKGRYAHSPVSRERPASEGLYGRSRLRTYSIRMAGQEDSGRLFRRIERARCLYAPIRPSYRMRNFDAPYVGVVFALTPYMAPCLFVGTHRPRRLVGLPGASPSRRSLCILRVATHAVRRCGISAGKSRRGPTRPPTQPTLLRFLRVATLRTRPSTDPDLVFERFAVAPYTGANDGVIPTV